MDFNKYLPAMIGLGIAFVAYKYGPNATVKAAALGVAGVIVAKQIPYLSAALA